MGEKMRLDRLVCSQMPDVSRADVKKLCLKCRIKVNGKLARRSDAHVDTDDEIFVGDTRVVYKKYIYIMLNKPQGVVCSTKEGQSRTVLDLVPEEMRRKGSSPQAGSTRTPRASCSSPTTGSFLTECCRPEAMFPRHIW